MANSSGHFIDFDNDRVTHCAPQQKRSRKTLEKILNATERLLENRIFEELTVKDIVREAGVSIGSFYARFKSKDLVLQDLYRRYREDLDSLKGHAFIKETEKMNLPELMEQIVHLGLARMESRRGLIRTIALHMRQHPLASGKKERKSARQARDVGVELIAKRRTEIKHKNPRQAARMVVFTLAALSREFVLFHYTPHASQLNLQRKQFVKETSRMLTNYLTCG